MSSAKSPKHSALGVVAAPCFFSLLVLAPFGPQRDLRLESKELRSWRRGPESNRRIEVLQTSALPLGYRALVKRDRSTPAPQGRRKPKSGDGEIWRGRQTRDAGNRTGWNSKAGEFGEQTGWTTAGRLDGRRRSLVGREAGDWGNGVIGRWEILGRRGEARCVVRRHTGSPNDLPTESAATAAAASAEPPPLHVSA